MKYMLLMYGTESCWRDAERRECMAVIRLTMPSLNSREPLVLRACRMAVTRRTILSTYLLS